jgi:hypothetical protein
LSGLALNRESKYGDHLLAIIDGDCAGNCPRKRWVARGETKVETMEETKENKRTVAS